MRHSRIILPLFVAVILGGCSFEEIFSKLATSNVEDASRQEFQQAKAAEAKQTRINQKRNQFSEITDLKNVNESDKNVAVAFRRISEKQTQIELEATLPNPGTKVYDLWLRSADSKTKINLGALKFNQTDDYSFSTTTDKDVSSLNTVVISKDEADGVELGTIVMTGSFNK